MPVEVLLRGTAAERPEMPLLRLIASAIVRCGSPSPSPAFAEWAPEVKSEIVASGRAIIDAVGEYWLTVAGLALLPGDVMISDVRISDASPAAGGVAWPDGRPTCATCGNWVAGCCRAGSPRKAGEWAGGNNWPPVGPRESCGEHGGFAAWRARRIAAYGSAGFVSPPRFAGEPWDGSRDRVWYATCDAPLGCDWVVEAFTRGIAIPVALKRRPMTDAELATLEAGGAVDFTPADIVDAERRQRVVYADAFGVVRACAIPGGDA